MAKYNNFSKDIQKEQTESIKLDFQKDEIFCILSENIDELKPVAIINLKSIENKKEADIILFHLTGHDSRIREAVSNILDEIGRSEFYLDEKSLNILINGILDINPNVARNLISFIKKNENLQTAISGGIIKKTREILENLEIYLRGKFVQNKEKSNKNHVKNKLTFNLYWLLTCLSILKIDENINDILTKTSNFLDYTIREKTALILSKMDNPPPELLHKLKNDENIYVKNQLL